MSKGAAFSEIQRVARDVWEEEADDPAAMPPAIELSEVGKNPALAADAYVFMRSEVLPIRQRKKTAKAEAHEAILEEKLKAIAQVLASFGLLDAVPRRKQEKLLKAIYAILDAPEE
jgi:hypothetical protein